jgi:hypothetical protein
MSASLNPLLHRNQVDYRARLLPAQSQYVDQLPAYIGDNSNSNTENVRPELFFDYTEVRPFFGQ